MSILIVHGTWAVPALALLVAAWQRFNEPPTNRSGTTWILFHLGLLFYYVLLLGIWILVVKTLESVGAGFYVLGQEPETRHSGEVMGRTAPIVGALIVVLAALFERVQELDARARAICLKLAAIPIEANRLAFQIRDQAIYRLNNQDIEKAIEEELERIQIPYEFKGYVTQKDVAECKKIVGLYCTFISWQERSDANRDEYPLSGAYKRFIARHPDRIDKIRKKYADFTPIARDFFGSSRPTDQLQKAYEKAAEDVLSHIADLVSRAVLSVEITANQRYRKLISFGLLLEQPPTRLGFNHYVTMGMATIGLFLAFYFVLPRAPSGGSFNEWFFKSIMIATMIVSSISLGVALAYRTDDDRRETAVEFPPIGLYFVGGLGAMLLSTMIRIVFKAVPTMGQGLNSSFTQSIRDYGEHWPWMIMSFAITFIVAVLCRYGGSIERAWWLVSGVGATIGGVVCMGAGVLVEVLFRDLGSGHAIGWGNVLIATGVTGFLIGGTVPVLYRESLHKERADRKLEAAIVQRIADSRSTSEPAPARGRSGEVPRRPARSARTNGSGEQLPEHVRRRGRSRGSGARAPGPCAAGD